MLPGDRLDHDGYRHRRVRGNGSQWHAGVQGVVNSALHSRRTYGLDEILEGVVNVELEEGVGCAVDVLLVTVAV